jgi:hypothetical protein
MTVDIAVSAVPWVPVPEVRLVVNGEVVFQKRVEQTQAIERGRWTVPVTLDKDSWIIAEAGWPLGRKTRPEGTTYARVALGHVPVGFTNPVWVDVDGDGVWTPAPAVEQADSEDR